MKSIFTFLFVITISIFNIQAQGTTDKALIGKFD